MSPSPCPPHPLRRRARARGGALSSASPSSTPASPTPPSSAWLRLLVLLVVALLAAGPHPEAFAAPPGNAAVETALTEHDVLATALRPPARQGHHPLIPLRPDTGHREPEPQPLPVHLPAPYSLTPHALRCVVLRC